MPLIFTIHETVPELQTELTYLQNVAAGKEAQLQDINNDITAAKTVVEASSSACAAATAARVKAEGVLKEVKKRNKDLRLRLEILVIARDELKLTLMERVCIVGLLKEGVEELRERVEGEERGL